MPDTFEHHHEHIANIISAVEHTVASGYGFDTVGMLFDHLVRYLDCHFSAEEAVMLADGFPHLEGHRMEHERCRASLCDVPGDDTQGGAAAVLSTLQFLRTWLAEHETESDQVYADFCQSLQRSGHAGR